MTQRLLGSLTAQDLTSERYNEFLCEMTRDAALYVGPVCTVSEPNSYYVPATADGGYQLVSDGDGKVRLLSNICPHFQRQLHAPAKDWSSGWKGKFAGGNIICNGHFRVFNANGAPMGQLEPLTEQERKCNHLATNHQPVNIGGMMWIGGDARYAPVYELLRLLAKRGINQFIPEGYVPHVLKIDNGTHSVHGCMRVYVDLLHIGKGGQGIHAGKLEEVVDMKTADEEYSSDLGVSVQAVSWASGKNSSTMSRYWQEYYELVKKAIELGYGDCDDTVGKVVWGAIYDNCFTHERYPFAVVNSFFLPKKTGGVRNVVEFFFSDTILAFLPELADAFVKAYCGAGDEEGILQEDARLVEECDRGTKHLVEIGYGERVIGPLHPTSESVVHAHDSYMSKRWESYKARYKT